MILQTQMLRGPERETMLSEIRNVLDNAADDAKHNNEAGLPDLHLYAAEAEADSQEGASPVFSTSSPTAIPKCCEGFEQELLAPSCIRCQWPSSGCMCDMSAALE